MKLAHVSTRFPPGPGGVERHVAEVGRRLAARGHSVRVLTSDLYQEFPWKRLPAEVARRETLAGVEVERIPVFSLPWELHYPVFRGLERALERGAPEIVHVHTYGTNQVAVARRFGRKRKVPFVLTAHYHPIWSIHGGWLRHRIRSFYDRVLAGSLVADAACVIVQTREEERLLREPGISLSRVAIVPPGYTPLPSPPAGERPFSTAYHVPGPFLLFVGRLASNKGLVPLIDSFQRWARRAPEAHLVLIGDDGGMRSTIERKIRGSGFASRIHLTGFVSDDRLLAAAYREARWLVLPSEYEAFGLVLLEALAQGTPVVATRVGGIPEFIEDGKNGRLVPPNDTDALTSVLEELWADGSARQRMGAYGQSTTVPRYSWERVVDDLERVYRSVAPE